MYHTSVNQPNQPQHYGDIRDGAGNSGNKVVGVVRNADSTGEGFRDGQTHDVANNDKHHAPVE